MLYFGIKTLITAVIVVAVSELAKRLPLMGAIIASLPLTSVLAMSWLYFDTKDIERVSSLSWNLFWVVVPSLSFFVALPVLLKQGFRFFPSMLISCVILFISYSGYIWMLRKLGIQI